MPEPFTEDVPGGEDRQEGTYSEVGHEEGVPEMFLEVLRRAMV